MRGVAGSDSICSPRAACQCSGEISRVGPAASRLARPSTRQVSANQPSTMRRPPRRMRNTGSMTAGQSLSPTPIPVSAPVQPGRRVAASRAAPARTAGTRSNRKYANGPIAGTNQIQNVTAVLRVRPVARHNRAVNAASMASIEATNRKANATVLSAPSRYWGSMTPSTGTGYSCSVSRIDPPKNSVCMLRA